MLAAAAGFLQTVQIPLLCLSYRREQTRLRGLCIPELF